MAVSQTMPSLFDKIPDIISYTRAVPDLVSIKIIVGGRVFNIYGPPPLAENRRRRLGKDTARSRPAGSDMVRKEEEISPLRKTLAENPQILVDYLMNRAKMAVILLDRQGHILDSNPYFLETAGLNEKHLGRSIGSIINENIAISERDEKKICWDVRFSFSANNMLEQTLYGKMIDMGDRYVIIAESIRLTHSEMIKKMSRLTDELTDLTWELNKKTASWLQQTRKSPN